MGAFLETERLRLRTFNTSDFENLYSLHSDPEVMRFSKRRSPESQQETAATLDRISKISNSPLELGFLAADLKPFNQFIGWFALGPLEGTSEIQIGYRIKKMFWSKGYATEGARELLRFALEDMSLKKIVAITDLDNLASQRVLDKLGFFSKGQVEYQASSDAPKEIVQWFEINR